MNLSLSITTYNRFSLTIESCAQILNDPRIDDIIILDDASTDGSYEKLREYYKDYSHVRVIRQAQNRGMSINKKDAIGYAKNDWVIIFDSDNVIGPDYLDAFYKMLDGDAPIGTIIYCPDFAKPNFDYTSLSGKAFTGFMVKREIGKNDKLNMAMNTCNYIVNRYLYLLAYKYDSRHVASDTIWFNYNWILMGGSFYFVPGMQYKHLVHKDSGFMQDAHYNMAQSEKVRKMIMAL